MKKFIICDKTVKDSKDNTFVTAFKLFFESIVRALPFAIYAFIVWIVIVMLICLVYCAFNSFDFALFLSSFSHLFTSSLEIDSSYQVLPSNMVFDVVGSLLRILVFAVLIGFFTDSFKRTIGEHHHKLDLKKKEGRIRNLFRPSQCPHTRLKVVPRYKSIATIQSRLSIKPDDILEIVEHAKDMRIRNLATTYSTNDEPQDRLVVEVFPYFKECRTSYGCKIDRNSTITIVSTSSYSEAGSGNFAYYLASFGGFNYISKEFEDNPESTTSFFNVKEENETCQPFIDFRNDLIDFTKKEGAWVIFILSTAKKKECNIHFNTNVENSVKEKYKITGLLRPDANTIFDDFFLKFCDALNNSHYEFRGDSSQFTDLKAERNTEFSPCKEHNIAVQCGAGDRFNAFILRLSWQISARDNRHTTIKVMMVDLIKRIIQGQNLNYYDYLRNNWCDNFNGQKQI